MVDVTLLELHLEDASFTANAPFSSEQSEGDQGGEGATEVSVGEGGTEETGGPSKLLVAVIMSGIAGALVWWLRRGRMPDIDEEIEVTP